MADPLTPTEEMSIYEAMRVNSYDLEWTQEATDVVMAIVEDRCAKAVAEHLKSLRMALNAGRPNDPALSFVLGMIEGMKPLPDHDGCDPKEH